MTTDDELLRQHAQFIVHHEAALAGAIAPDHFKLAKWMLARIARVSTAVVTSASGTITASDRTVPTPLPMPAFVEHVSNDDIEPMAPIEPERSDGIPHDPSDHAPTLQHVYVEPPPHGQLAPTGMYTLADAIASGKVQLPPHVDPRYGVPTARPPVGKGGGR